MIPNLHDIRRACPRVLGGLKTLMLIDPRDLQSQPGFYLIPNIISLSFKTGKRAFILEQDKFSGSLEGDPETSNRAGDFFTYRLQATVRNNRLIVDLQRMKLMNRRIHVVATYQDGYQRFVPYMRLSATDSSGRRATDRSGYSFSGVCRIITPAPSIAATLTLPPVGGGGGGGSSSDAMQPVIISGITGSTYTYTIPAGFLLLGIYVKSNAAQTVDIGTTSGGTEITEDFSLSANQYGVAGTMMLHADTDTDIFFSNLAGTNKIILYLVEDDPT